MTPGMNEGPSRKRDEASVPWKKVRRMVHAQSEHGHMDGCPAIDHAHHISDGQRRHELQLLSLGEVAVAVEFLVETDGPVSARNDGPA
ncbi:hypothetical protein [Kocuria sabuli]|uniref:hypothetical protein n=1 Tax=Kocuria sabuli TaxID=3071448 RepID=UPI0034D4F06E